MTTRISLDTGALSALIDQDPEFELQIKHAVLENLARRYVKGVGTEVVGHVKAAVINATPDINEMVSKLGAIKWGNWRSGNSTFTLRPEIKASLGKAIHATLEEEFAAMQKFHSDMIDRRMEDYKKAVTERIEHAMRSAEDKEIRERVQTKVAKALAKLNMM